MADVFLSYRNTPDRRAIVRRLATVLRTYGMTVWWDYGLEAGESYRAQIMSELASARIVAPLWCVESVQSPWVRMEAEFGKDKLLPARLQKVMPPVDFEAIQAADLVDWDGSVNSPRLLDFVRLICKRLDRPATAPSDLIEELAELPRVKPLLEVASASPASAAIVGASPTHDYAFWERQWEKQGTGTNLVVLRDIANEAPPYFANQAYARIAELEKEAAQRREAEERERRIRKTEEQRRAREMAVAPYRAEGRIKVDAQIVHGAPEGWFKPGAGEVEWFKDLDVGPEMVVVPAGSFMMGSEEYSDESPVHLVEIRAPLAVGRYAMTFAEWDVAGLEHKPADRGWGRGRRPVINVSWDDAEEYARWLSQKTGKAYRLISEAEWEYCCRAGTTTKYAFGNSITNQLAQFSASTTTEVGTFPPNGWGLYDMHGNVWEWCKDDWHPDYIRKSLRDGSAWGAGASSSRVLRGGAWNYDLWFLRSANRTKSQVSYRQKNVGFRIARTL
jgi:formylglycine-generating enzyme required for sulfatase activity